MALQLALAVMAWRRARCARLLSPPQSKSCALSLSGNANTTALRRSWVVIPSEDEAYATVLRQSWVVNLWCKDVHELRGRLLLCYERYLRSPWSYVSKEANSADGCCALAVHELRGRLVLCYARYPHIRCFRVGGTNRLIDIGASSLRGGQMDGGLLCSLRETTALYDI